MNRVGVIGLGNISKRHRRNLKHHFGAETVAMSASGNSVGGVEDADLFAVNIDDLIAKQPDWVFIASPANSHVGLAIQCLAHGIPVLIEKPLCINKAEGLSFLSRLDQAELPTAVGYCLRFLPAATVVKTAIEDNKVGNVLTAFANCGQYLPDWRPDTDYRASVSARAELGGGALLELSHELDMISWLLGPLSLEYARVDNTSSLGLEVEDRVDLSLRSSGDTACFVHLDFLQKPAQRFIHLVGDAGRLYWDLLSSRVVLFSDAGEETIYEQKGYDFNEMYISMINEFQDHVSGKQPKRLASVAEACRLVELIEECKLGSGFEVNG